MMKLTGLDGKVYDLMPSNPERHKSEERVYSRAADVSVAIPALDGKKMKKVQQEIEEESEDFKRIYWVNMPSNWPDKDGTYGDVEKIYYGRLLRTDPSRYAFLLVREYTWVLMKRLNKKLKKLDFYKEMDKPKRNSFTSAIVAKGKDFYKTVMKDPQMCQYLVEKKLYRSFLPVMLDRCLI